MARTAQRPRRRAAVRAVAARQRRPAVQLPAFGRDRGSRAATAYGSYVAAEFAASVAARGWAVISGGAYGVDAAAHRGALGAEGVTVAVLACGVDMPYPAGHTELLDAIAAQGVVVSEWPPGRYMPAGSGSSSATGSSPRWRPGTLVVEAGQRSGALNTARHARDLSRRLMAVPGPVTSDLSAGCHHIIREWQGTLVTSAAEVIECLSPIAAASGLAPPAVLGRDALDPETAAVLDALPSRGGMGPNRIGHRAGLEPGTVLRCLRSTGGSGFRRTLRAGLAAPPL